MDLQGLKVYKVYINDDPGLTLTYFTARSNLVKIAHCASDQQSGERLQDRWSSGIILCKINLAIILYGSVNPHQILHFIF